MIWLRSIASFISARATYFIVIALSAAIAAHFVQIGILKLTIGKREKDIHGLEIQVEALVGVNAWNETIINNMDQVAKENRERLHLAEIRAKTAQSDLADSKETITRNAKESDRRLQRAYADNKVFAEQIVPDAIWDEVL